MTAANFFAAGDRHVKAQASRPPARTSRDSPDPEDFEQSFSELFETANQRIGASDNDPNSDFYESVRESLRRLREKFEVPPNHSVGRAE
jgi:hypothetical protein